MIFKNLALKKGDALIIVPPFFSTGGPSLAAHILQSCAKKGGFDVKVLYANLYLASEIGERNYETLCLAPGFLGERFFVSAAYNLPLLGNDNGQFDSIFDDLLNKDWGCPKIELSTLRTLAAGAANWADTICDAVANYEFKVIGCTTTFQQTAASVALLNRIKRVRPETVTIIGGINCEGEMAEGIYSLGASIDHIFSGECEKLFPRFLTDIQMNKRPLDKILYGEPCNALDKIPCLDFSEYYNQYKSCLLNSQLWNHIRIIYESSRGCWWGQKHQCTFCGFNAHTINYRQKSADRVICDLKELLKNHPNKCIVMTDCIMPYSYFKTLIPRIKNELPGLHIFYELKANMSLEKIIALKEAGVDCIQPGIESLSTKCLRLMNKGVSARQNINLLRYLRSVGIETHWNLMCGIPGDKLNDYKDMLNMLPLIHHLPPPHGPTFVRLDRFSPYLNDPNKYNIRNVRPASSYSAILPPNAKIQKIASYFIGDYECETLENPDFILHLTEEVNRWCDSWRSKERIPTLVVNELRNDWYLLLDTRGLSETEEICVISQEQAWIALIGSNKGLNEKLIKWALKKKLIARTDSEYIPLATASPDLLLKFRELREWHQ